MTDQYDPNGAYSEVFEEGMDLQQAQTIHRIRANSTIMQLKKILGESHPDGPLAGWAWLKETRANCDLLQLPIEERFVCTPILDIMLCYVPKLTLCSYSCTSSSLAEC
jgi:hypothetical protein